MLGYSSMSMLLSYLFLIRAYSVEMNIIYILCARQSLLDKLIVSMSAVSDQSHYHRVHMTFKSIC